MVGRFRRLDLRFLTAHTTEGIAKSTTRPMVNSTGAATRSQLPVMPHAHL